MSTMIFTRIPLPSAHSVIYENAIVICYLLAVQILSMPQIKSTSLFIPVMEEVDPLSLIFMFFIYRFENIYETRFHKLHHKKCDFFFSVRKRKQITTGNTRRREWGRMKNWKLLNKKKKKRKVLLPKQGILLNDNSRVLAWTQNF